MWLIFVSELEKKELPGGYDEGSNMFHQQMLKSSPPGCNKYECLRLKKTDVTLWLNLKVVQFASERVESLPAAKRRKLDERSESEVVVDLGKILQSKAWTDFQITASCGRIFDVHRCILAGMNEAFFKSVCLF
jgi:hypothetical protein